MHVHKCINLIYNQYSLLGHFQFMEVCVIVHLHMTQQECFRFSCV